MEKEIEKIALEKYPIREFYIGSGETSRLYDENLRDRIIFTKGVKMGIELLNQPTPKD